MSKLKMIKKMVQLNNVNSISIYLFAQDGCLIIFTSKNSVPLIRLLIEIFLFGGFNQSPEIFCLM
jgi:hypothetical protein